MRRWSSLTGLLMLLYGLSGCADPALFISLSGVSPDIAHMQVQVRLNGVRVATQDIGLANRFVVRLPNAATGPVQVQLLALDQRGCTVAKQTLDVEPPGGLNHAAEYALTLATVNPPSCSQTVCNAANWCQYATGLAPLPGSETDFLYGVSGSGPSDVWAVGGDAMTILRWQGQGWSRFGQPTTYIVHLRGVWENVPTGDMWAVGHGDGTVAMVRWNGSTWDGIYLAPMLHFNGVWGNGHRDVWAVGDSNLIQHWNGSQWNSVPGGRPGGLAGVWGSGPTDVWAVGDGIVRWDGSQWNTFQSAATASTLFGVWGSGPNDVHIAGATGLQHCTSSECYMVYSTMEAVYGVWGSGPNDAWAVGDRGMILHWNGGLWTPVDSGTTNHLRGVWGSGPSDVWVVGLGGTILRYQP